MSWRHLSLKDISKVIAGQSPEGKYYNNDGIGLPFYQGKKNFTKKYLGKPEKWTKKVTKEAIKGDILMSVRAPVGPVNIATEKVCIGRGLASIRVNKNIDLNYVYNYLVLNESKINGNEGAVFNSINKKQIESISIPIPTLSEQKQIAETLDKAFEKIDKAIANVERNIQNAEELLQSQIESRFNSDLSWERFNLGDLSKIMYGHTSKVDPNGNCKYLRITDIQDSKVNWDQVPSIKIDEKDFLKYNLTKGDIVFARTGATTGKSYLIKDNPNAVFASYLIRVQINNNNILPEFVYKFFSSREYWRVVKSGISGSAQGGFNASKLSELEIKFPKDIIVQSKVVQEIDIIEKITNTLLSKYHKKLLSLSNVKKSILEKAFKGELTNAA